MARIKEEFIRKAKETPIIDLWRRLGYPEVRPGGLCRSPFREDKNPSCQVGGDKNIVTDYGGPEYLDPIGLVRRARSVGFKEAVAYVLNVAVEELLDRPQPSAGHKDSGEGSPSSHSRSKTSGSFPLDAIEELAQLRGWRPEALRALGAESRNAQAPREVHFPMRNAKGDVIGFRRRRSDGKRFSGGEKVKAIYKGKNGLFCPWPFPDEHKSPVLVTEGEADACAALSAGFAAVVATPGADASRESVSALQKFLVNREVVLFPDPDTAGRNWLERIGRVLANARCVVRFVPADKVDLDKRLRYAEDRHATLAELVKDALLFVTNGKDAAPTNLKGKLPPLVLPNEAHGESITDTAQALFPAVAPKHTLFDRGGRMVEVTEQNGESILNLLSPDAFRSRIEHHFEVVVYRAAPNQGLALKPTVCPRDTARALMETVEARRDLPTIAGVSGCPLIDPEGRILGKGYDPKTGWFVTSGQTPPEVPLEEATQALSALLDDFDFVCPSDRSRALAAFITPALRLGGALNLAPCDVAEANASQSGKTYRQKVIAAIYNEIPRLITQRQTGGVGSFDESLSARLAEGRPFIQIDNVRGKLDSANLEAFMTSERAFPVRLPYKGEMMIDPSRFFILVTSNGFETTRDFANRSSIVRIRKRPQTTAFREYPEGDLLSHVRAKQPYYLGCVFAVVRGWLEAGKPRSQESRHDFRDWARSLDWIVQNLFKASPLLDDHDEARERVSDPGKGFIRAIAAHVEQAGRLGEQLTASDIYELAEENEIAVPALKRWDEGLGKRRVGAVMSKAFSGADQLDLDGYRIVLGVKEVYRPNHFDHKKLKSYTFQRIEAEFRHAPTAAATPDTSEDSPPPLLPF